MIESSFNEIIERIKGEITKTQLDIMVDANNKIINLYYKIGEMLEKNSEWGNKFIDRLSYELNFSFPNLKGFSVRNLKYMKKFYNEYSNTTNLLNICKLLPWKHNIILIEKVKSKEIRKWYMKKCLEEGWTKNILIYQIDTKLYDRQEKTNKHNNFNLTLNQNSKLANEIQKDPYIFDIIELTDNYKERELENKIIEKIKKILLEFGNGFSYVGNQYKLTAEHQDFFLDLLFYHINLKCYVAVELKRGEFKPEYASKMGFYLTILDDKVRGNKDNPSIGIILCSNKKNKIVDYTLKYINKPMGVSEYKIFNRLTKEIKEQLSNENIM